MKAACRSDLIKDPAIIEAAYNDSQGVTAAFNRNLLRVLNTRVGAGHGTRTTETGEKSEQR